MKTMNATHMAFCFAGSLLLLAHVVYGQAEMRRPGEVAPTFYVDAMAYAAAESQKSRIDIYVQVPHEEIRFLKEGDTYVGRYEVTLSLLTVAKQLMHEQTWSVDVPVNDFAQTTGNRLYSLTHRTVDIAPGNYQLNVVFRDQESRKSSQVRKSLLVTDFSRDSLSLSDIMLVNRLSVSGEKKTIVPNITGSINPRSEGFFLFLELYCTPRLDSVDLLYTIFDSKKNEVLRRSQREAIAGSKTQIFIKVDSASIPMGTHFLSVEAVAQDGINGKSYRATTSRTLSVRSPDLPAAILDIDKAIDQLMYIARESEMQYIRDGGTQEEKRKRFMEFWAKRDPDSGTQRNELMEEYYGRILYANQNFSHYMEGWRTDMGMVFIRFGTPENIERHPLEIDSKPYEIWYYYQQSRQFVFVDESGFGDYRLTYPTTDLWGRVR
jgi:GWxTD domain-containing protein